MQNVIIMSLCDGIECMDSVLGQKLLITQYQILAPKG
jgi:hypothetical protein